MQSGLSSFAVVRKEYQRNNRAV